MSPAPAPPYYPTSGLVAVAWLGQRVPGVSPAGVATSLPRELTWTEQGFVQATVVTGAPDVDVQLRRPTVQVDCWATSATPGTVKPPIAKAFRLAELIMHATANDVQAFGGVVTLPAGYLPARVLSVYPITEPAEVADDPAGYARVTFDLALDWARV